MRGPLLAILALLVAVPAYSQDLRVVGIEIGDKGIHRLDTGAATSEKNTPTGEITKVLRAKLVLATDVIPAMTGTEFGFQYVLLGSPGGADVTLNMVITYPQQGLTNPDTGKILRQSRYSQVKQTGKSEYMGYGFESNWEAEPGIWVFQIWHDGNILTEHHFIVKK